MQRQLMDELIAWKSRANRKPLLLKGARQTGKTWLLNEFAGQQYQNVIRFDFMLEPGVRSLFDGSLDPKRIISQIELLRGQTITPTNPMGRMVSWSILPTGNDSFSRRSASPI